MRSLPAVLLLAAACQQAPSKLDKARSDMPAEVDTAAPAGAPTPAPSGSLEERVAKLEGQLRKYAEPLDFLAKVYAQQKQQQQAQERDEPAPDAIFAVDIAADIKAGQVEGPMGAAITIVEAWDFA
jgi:hypothetical protein